MSKSKIELGDIAKHTITGYEGTVVGRTRWLDNVDTISLQATAKKEGKIPKAQGFDEPRVTFVRAGKIKPIPVVHGDVGLGDLAKDELLGIQGVVVAIRDDLNGCARVGLQPVTLKDGDVRDAEWCDERNLRVVKRHTRPTIPSPPSGGPRPEPARFAGD